MKTTILSIALLLIGAISFSQVTLKISSGDTDLDASLTDINVTASKDFGLFKTEMKASYNVTDAKLEDLKLTFGMQASDIFMTLEIALTTGKTVDVVAAEFKKSKGKGWGEIAKNLGIKPGSDAFHALKGTAKKKNDKIKGNSSSKGNNGKGKGKK